MENKKENEINLYYIYELNSTYTEKELRSLLLQNEVEHILNNRTDYINGDLNILVQCETIKQCLIIPIEKVIERLKDWWSYTITKLQYRTYITTIEINQNARFEQVQSVLDYIQKYYSKEFVKVTSQCWKYYEDNKKTLSITIQHKSSNIDIDFLNDYLESQTIVDTWKI